MVSRSPFVFRREEESAYYFFGGRIASAVP
jgi:hypothetical protein